MIKKIKEYPKNKEHYLKLIEFGKEICSICNELGFEPISYGSLMFFAYTGNKFTPINDLDFLVPGTYFSKIVYVFKKKGIRVNYIPKWHIVQVFKGDLKIELDSIDFWQKGLSKEYTEFDFNGLIVKGVSLRSLIKVYKQASEVSTDNPEGNRRKYEILKKVK